MYYSEYGETSKGCNQVSSMPELRGDKEGAANQVQQVRVGTKDVTWLCTNVHALYRYAHAYEYSLNIVFLKTIFSFFSYLILLLFLTKRAHARV